MSNKPFGKELDEIRESLGYTREKVAEILGCGVLILDKLANEVIDSMYYFWTVDQFLKYCSILKVNYKDYLKRSIYYIKYYPKLVEYYNVDYDNLVSQIDSGVNFDYSGSIQEIRKKYFHSRKILFESTKITISSIQSIEVNFPHGIGKSKMIDVLFYFYHIQSIPILFSLNLSKSNLSQLTDQPRDAS
jgi:transcriptional regulator with XRE-family HTH domain